MVIIISLPIVQEVRFPGPLRDHVSSNGLTLRKTAHFDKSGVINTDFLSATESAKNKP